MDYSKCPVAKRTRGGIDRLLIEKHLERKEKRVKTAAAGGRAVAPVTEPVELILVDEDEGPSGGGFKKGKCSKGVKSRKCSSNEKTLENVKEKKGNLGRMKREECSVNDGEEVFDKFGGRKVFVEGNGNERSIENKKEFRENYCVSAGDLSSGEKDEKNKWGQKGVEFCCGGNKKVGVLESEEKVIEDTVILDECVEGDEGKNEGRDGGNVEENIVEEKQIFVISDSDDDLVMEEGTEKVGTGMVEMENVDHLVMEEGTEKVATRTVEMEDVLPSNDNGENRDEQYVSSDDLDESEESEASEDTNSDSDVNYQEEEASGADDSESSEELSESDDSDDGDYVDEKYRTGKKSGIKGKKLVSTPPKSPRLHQKKLRKISEPHPVMDSVDSDHDDDECRAKKSVVEGNRAVATPSNKSGHEMESRKFSEPHPVMDSVDDDECRAKKSFVIGNRPVSTPSNNSGHEMESRKFSEPHLVVETYDSSSESDDHSDCSGEGSVSGDVGKSRTNLSKTPQQTSEESMDFLTICSNSLNIRTKDTIDLGGLLPKEENRYKFRFADEDPKPEKSEYEVEIDILFKEANESRASLTKVDYRCPVADTPTDQAACCSRGIHELIYNEQVGLVCKFCSHVDLEIRDILPPWQTPSSRRGRDYYVPEEGPIHSDYFRGAGAENHGFKGSNYKSGTVWDLIPGTRNTMYQHQREGFEFIWKNVAGGIEIEKMEKPLSANGGGCIISHAPGTGKTRLAVVFLQSFMRLYPEAKPVIIAPKSMLLTWEEELKKWKVDIPFHNMNNLELSGQENAGLVCLAKKQKQRVNNNVLTRLLKLTSWKVGRSILGISYGLFEKLVEGMKRNNKCNPGEEDMAKALLKVPTLLVLDEGHTPRNNQSNIWKCLFQVDTERRIILSGTPFQNNFSELYNTMCVVNPKFGRSTSEYDGAMNKNRRKISKESKCKWASLTKLDGDSDKNLKELNDLIRTFVHVHKGNILREKLPGLRDSLILLRPTDLQKQLMALLRPKESTISYLEFSHVTSLLSVHPSLLPDNWFKEEEFSEYKDKLQKLENYPYCGAKTKFVIELCRLSEAWGERVLIFSQFIDPLMFLKKQLRNQFDWIEGRELLYMDGKLDEKQRQSSISSLNDPKSKVRVLLASTKACSEGINLVGASRVVLLDVVWNPSVERQAISRAYRLGQKKTVYTYHLISGKMEVKRYKSQVDKDRLSELVFASNEIGNCKEKMPSIAPEDRLLQAMFQQNDKLDHMFEDIIYQPKESDLIAKLGVAENSQ